MQVELLDGKIRNYRLELVNAIFYCMEIFYNHRRRHSAPMLPRFDRVRTTLTGDPSTRLVGHHDWNPTVRADQLPMVEHATGCVSIRGSTDYWDHATMIELASCRNHLRAEVIALDDALASPYGPTETESTLATILRLRKKSDTHPEYRDTLEKALRGASKTPGPQVRRHPNRRTHIASRRTCPECRRR
ncbi:hypothetical protein ACWEKT_38870 [Nocardia takedensis]|uniref:hypothetical protein n=1 Tax=Nocardia takedensis TaxID=259390 RepID=UPI0012F68F2F|nr:hypothetical protein [Nocardia takedensis]